MTVNVSQVLSVALVCLALGCGSEVLDSPACDSALLAQTSADSGALPTLETLAATAPSDSVVGLVVWFRGIPDKDDFLALEREGAEVIWHFIIFPEVVLLRVPVAGALRIEAFESVDRVRLSVSLARVTVC